MEAVVGDFEHTGAGWARPGGWLALGMTWLVDVGLLGMDCAWPAGNDLGLAGAFGATLSELSWLAKSVSNP